MKSVVGILGCIVGLGVIYFGFGIGTESPKKDAVAGPSRATATDPSKPVRAMNLALGNMVFFSQDLGFSVRNTKDEAVNPAKIVARIEGQLQGMRELFRGEIARNPSLAGTITLQFNIAPSGEVSQVREVASRINDSDFKRAVLAEGGKWSFAETVAEPVSVTCPLLFVHQGMDITTLVQWEKFVGQTGEKPAPAPVAAGNAPTPALNAPATPLAAKSAPAPTPAKMESVARPEAKVFQIKYASSLRKEPNFSAASLVTFTIGTRVTVLGKQGDWLQVRSNDNGPTGFIRKEFVVPVDVAHK
jgi:hypothetical protein